MQRSESLGIEFEDPKECLSSAETAMDLIPQDNLFRDRDPKYQKLREKWCAGLFGVGYIKYVRNCQVGLNESNYRKDADFFLRTDNEEYPFQSVEVLKPGRKRGDEYKKITDGGYKLTPYEPERGRIEGSKWIKKEIDKKVKKNYAGSKNLNLLVYENFDANQLDYNQLSFVLNGYKQYFCSIWVITNADVCSIFSTPELGEILGWGKVRDISYPYQ